MGAGPARSARAWAMFFAYPVMRRTSGMPASAARMSRGVSPRGAVGPRAGAPQGGYSGAPRPAVAEGEGHEGQGRGGQRFEESATKHALARLANGHQKL